MCWLPLLELRKDQTCRHVISRRTERPWYVFESPPTTPILHVCSACSDPLHACFRVFLSSNPCHREPFFLGSAPVDVEQALICSLLPDAQPSPTLTANFPSNNPFRNRATSPASHHSLPSPQLATFNVPQTAPQRPISRNPFLDHTSQAASDTSAAQDNMPLNNSPPTGDTAELFVRPCLPFDQYLI